MRLKFLTVDETKIIIIPCDMYTYDRKVRQTWSVFGTVDTIHSEHD